MDSIEQKDSSRHLTIPQWDSAVVTIIATLRWASCGPGTGLQAHPLKSQYIFASSQEISINDRILPWITRKLRIW